MTCDFDVIVAGAGAAGLAAALALAQEGFATALIGEAAAPNDGRTVALLDGSVRFLKALGAWQRLAEEATPMQTMRLIDATSSLFRSPPVEFRSSEIKLDAFGHNVENIKLVDHLAAEAAARANLTLFPVKVTGYAVENNAAVVTLENGQRLKAHLAVGAEGRNSPLRHAAGIATKTWPYPQVAITTVLSHRLAHNNTSTEFHTRAGPFTLVPLSGNHSSLVWVNHPDEANRLAALDNEAFARAVEKRAHHLLGAMKVAGPRGKVPLSGMSAISLTAPRLVLIGEAAHVFPPIGAQGLNLGLRDAAALRDALISARLASQDIGSADVLTALGKSRVSDTALRTNVIDLLNRTLLADFIPADFIRGAGLLTLGISGPLRRLIMRESLTPSLYTPRQMQRLSSAPNAELSLFE